MTGVKKTGGKNAGSEQAKPKLTEEKTADMKETNTKTAVKQADIKKSGAKKAPSKKTAAAINIAAAKRTAEKTASKKPAFVPDKAILAKGAELVARLKTVYPDGECQLKYEGEPWRLLVMGILSAQCTDIRVNIIAEELFAAYPDVYSMAEADITKIEELIRTCGLWRGKAAAIKGSCEIIVEKHGGELPSSMEDLTALPGVGRKIANLIRGDIFGFPAIVADTHCIRLAARIGFTEAGERDPYRTEMRLSEIIAPEEQVTFCHRFVLFGREFCTARSPKCEGCLLADICCKNL
jgi:endonuclease-3